MTHVVDRTDHPTTIEVRPGDWARIGHALPVQCDWRQEPTERPEPLAPHLLAQLLVARAKRYDRDAREARALAANCRKYASELMLQQ